MNRLLSAFVICFVLTTVKCSAADIIIADFEGETYSTGWKTEGTAFGTGSAKGTLKGQMNVSGFLGKGLVNSYLGGDGATGKLTSPVFKVERPYISFLIGGGGHPGLEMNLIVDGKTVRTAAGPNLVPGGSEMLEWGDWDTADLQGREAYIEIIDNATGGWGHINVDNIIQTDSKHSPIEKRIDIIAGKNFLHIPIDKNSRLTWVRVEADGVPQQEFNCPLAADGKVDFYADLQISQWKGKKITLIAEKVSENNKGLQLVRQADELAHQDTVYTEKYRPQFHFSPRTGWTNDPNGLVYYKGTYHLFFQHNPFGTNWGNMTWGHAASPDLIHWTQHADALNPDTLGTMYSGSAVVDENNTSGFQTGDEKPLVLIYTADGGGSRAGKKTSQCIAYSTDAGKTFTKYKNNPVLPHIVGGNRDPKVIWYEPAKQWIMALYLDKEDYALFSSKNLIHWEKCCDIKNLGCSECPDFFPLAVDGNKENIKWVFWGANGKYVIGSFDGKEFKPESKTQTAKYGGNDYAAQTYSDVPNSRRIQISWMNGGKYPDMPFNQQFSVPRELTLRTVKNGTTPDEIKLFTEPVKEIETLRDIRLLSISNEKADPYAKIEHKFNLPSPNFPPSDVEIIIAADKAADGKAAVFILEAAGQKIEYNFAEEKISLNGITAPLKLQDGKLTLRILVDRTSLELFAQHGEVQIAECFVSADTVSADTVLSNISTTAARQNAIKIKAEGSITIERAAVWKMKSAWKP